MAKATRAQRISLAGWPRWRFRRAGCDAVRAAPVARGHASETWRHTVRVEAPAAATVAQHDEPTARLADGTCELSRGLVVLLSQQRSNTRRTEFVGGVVRSISAICGGREPCRHRHRQLLVDLGCRHEMVCFLPPLAGIEAHCAIAASAPPMLTAPRSSFATLADWTHAHPTRRWLVFEGAPGGRAPPSPACPRRWLTTMAHRRRRRRRAERWHQQRWELCLEPAPDSNASSVVAVSKRRAHQPHPDSHSDDIGDAGGLDMLIGDVQGNVELWLVSIRGGRGGVGGALAA